MEIYAENGTITKIFIKEWRMRNDLLPEYIDHTSTFEKLFSWALFFTSHLMLIALIRNLYICKKA